MTSTELLTKAERHERLAEDFRLRGALESAGFWHDVAARERAAAATERKAEDQALFAAVGAPKRGAMQRNRPRAAAMVAMYRDGRTLTEIASEHRLTRDRVREILRAEGVVPMAARKRAVAA